MAQFPRRQESRPAEIPPPGTTTYDKLSVGASRRARPRASSWRRAESCRPRTMDRKLVDRVTETFFDKSRWPAANGDLSHDGAPQLRSQQSLRSLDGPGENIDVALISRVARDARTSGAAGDHVHRKLAAPPPYPDMPSSRSRTPPRAEPCRSDKPPAAATKLPPTLARPQISVAQIQLRRRPKTAHRPTARYPTAHRGCRSYVEIYARRAAELKPHTRSIRNSCRLLRQLEITRVTRGRIGRKVFRGVRDRRV